VIVLRSTVAFIVLLGCQHITLELHVNSSVLLQIFCSEQTFASIGQGACFDHQTKFAFAVRVANVHTNAYTVATLCSFRSLGSASTAFQIAGHLEFRLGVERRVFHVSFSCNGTTSSFPCEQISFCQNT
jgi:hypothetical protein